MKTLARPQDATDLLARVVQIHPNLRPKWGRMSAHQMVCHVNDCFRMATERRPVRPAGSPLKGTVLKWIALYAPMRWPTGIRTLPEVDAQGDGTPARDFADDLADLETLMQRFTKLGSDLDDIAHPLFGRMSQAAWLRWGYLHSDHHLRQFGL